MYVLTHNNKVLVGPVNWNKGLFQGSLSKLGITHMIPRNPPDTLPLVLGETTNIKLVQIIKPEINPYLEHHYGPLWNLTGEVAIAEYQIHDTELPSAKMNLIQLAAKVRYEKEITGTTTTIQNTQVTIDTNRGSRDIFVQKLLLMPDETTVNWKFPEGWLTLTKSDLSAAVTAGVMHVQAQFDWEKDVVTQINNAVNKAELLTILTTELLPTPEPEPEIEE